MGGRLAGFTYREVTQKLNNFGFSFLRQGKGDHEMWYNQEKNLYTTVVNKGGKNLKEGTLRAILRQCGIDVNDFLEK
ncbi:MAG: addiction module toxin, HicA family [candidate division SR1 bacterium CG_4_9_14_3_um_filter_40_9]|nr:MAG: addiction module toxin, HicA family [candidate division SR1 bacterium CG_4_9_14_3_um_filter_40_9]